MRDHLQDMVTDAIKSGAPAGPSRMFFMNDWQSEHTVAVQRAWTVFGDFAILWFPRGGARREHEPVPCLSAAGVAFLVG
jgi:hypothetical protein